MKKGKRKRAGRIGPAGYSTCGHLWQQLEIIDLQGFFGYNIHDVNAEAAYIHWACTAPQNNKHEFGSQKYEGVGGHLFAIAVDKSIQWGYNGVLHGFARNRELVNHYVQTFGAVYLGRLHEYQIAVFEQEARKLLEVYTYEWNGSKENP